MNAVLEIEVNSFLKLVENFFPIVADAISIIIGLRISKVKIGIKYITA